MELSANWRQWNGKGEAQNVLADEGMVSHHSIRCHADVLQFITLSIMLIA